ncbi:MAG: DUF4350 domain-containing protein [Pseudomonadota bacterium]
MSRAFLYTAGALMTLVFGIWFFANFERVEIEKETPWTPEAYRNDYLAAQLLVEAAGIESDSIQSKSSKMRVPETSGAIVATLTGTVAHARSLQSQLEQWTADGGHVLLLIPDDISDAGIDWLELFGIEHLAIDWDEVIDEDISDDTVAEEEDTYFIALDAVDSRLSTTVGFGSPIVVGDRHGQIAVRVPYGDGYVTAFASTYLFTNWAIDEQDHARLFLDLVVGEWQPSAVWFFLDIDTPPLYRLLWQWVPLTIVTLGVLLIIWLWSQMPRFGPMRAFGAEAPRSLIEHVRAAGALSWRQRATVGLHQASVDALIERAARLRPEIRTLAPADQAQHLSAMTGIDGEEIRYAITNLGSLSAVRFIEKIQRLQAIRKAL